MLKHSLKIAVRNLFKRKLISFIQLTGLTMGIAAFWVIIQYVSFEKSYDKFYSQSENVFRVAIDFYSKGELTNRDAMNYAPTGPALVDELSDVNSFVRITPEYGKIIFRRGDILNEETKVFYADSSMFKFFDYHFISGSSKNALSGSNKVVLGRSVAEKYFGPLDTWQQTPIGQIINFNNRKNLIITGVVQDSPGNTHFKFNALISFDTFQAENDNLTNNWGWNDFYTYVLTTPGTTKEKLQSQMPSFLDRHLNENHGNVFLIQPLTDIHLNSKLGYEAEINGDGNMVNALAIIAFIILVIAWINYVNLATARGEERAKEVGIRKVAGATKVALIYQFLGEAFIVNFVANVLSISIAYFSLPYLGAVIDQQLTFTLIEQPPFWVGLGVILIAGTLLSGLYPAFILSSFDPLDVLKGSSKKSRNKNLIRKVLVTFQFITATILITGTIVIYEQVSFIRTKPLGFDLSQKIIISAPGVYNVDTVFQEKYFRFKNALRQMAQVKNTTISSAIPGKSDYDLDTNGGISLVGQAESKSASFWVYRVDDDFIDIYDFEVIAGRGFKEEFKGDDEKLVLNRAAVHRLGISNPEEIIGKKLNYWNSEREVIGVVENYHHKSPKSNFLPMIIKNQIQGMLYYTVEIEASNTNNMKVTLEEIQTIWQQVYADNPFTYFYLEDHFNDQFQADLQIGKVFATFALLAILITCLGLFGLSSYMVIIRMKEIGIRKVLGATSAQIISILSRDYLSLIGISTCLALPLGYYYINLWLDDFAWRIEISWWILLIPVLLVSLLSLLTVSGLSFKAANLNPVNTLRDE